MRSARRFRVGVATFVYGFAAPLTIPLLMRSGLETAWKTAVSGALALGVPEIMMVVGTAVMGKEGFTELRRSLGRFVARHGPPRHVGPVCYWIGLVMFTLPLLLIWNLAWVAHIPITVFLKRCGAEQ